MLPKRAVKSILSIIIMKHLVTSVTVLAVMATSCIDDNYDLSDIDTTSRLQVSDLTLPVNMDDVTLGDIITFDDNSKIKPVTIDGSEFYALTQSGDFKSEGIYIKKVSVAAPTLPSVTETLNLLPGSRAAATQIRYSIGEMGNDFSYTASDLDSSIDALYAAGVEPLTFGVSFSAPEASTIATGIALENVTIAMPKGLTATASTGTYDAATGLWTIPSVTVSGTSATASLTATAIDLKANGATAGNGRLSFNSQFRVKSGELTIEPNLQAASVPQTMKFTIDFTLGNLMVNSMSGRLSYKLNGMHIDPISLSDIPDFLSGDGTNIALANPQIYLGLNNPVADNRLIYSTGLRFSAIRGGRTDYTCSPDNGPISVGYNYGVAGPYNFVLAPSQDGLSTPGAFANGLQYVKFSGLKDLLAAPAGSQVKGLPEAIDVELVDPQIPTQDVQNFTLGRTLQGVNGAYEIVAPLALTDGSVVVYSDREDGWNDDDIDAITITRLRVTADVTNNCPVSATLSAYPIDVHGNRIPGVEIKTVKPLAANSADQPIEIEMTGTVTHLDGIVYEATLTGSSSGRALSPSQTIVLRNIRATVSGYYDKEF